MAATTVENLEFHIKKTGLTGDGAQILKDYASALRELKAAGRGNGKNPIPDEFIHSISELAGAMKAINGEAISKMRQLAAALKTFDGMKGVKLNAQFASTMADIAAAADLITEGHIGKLNRFGDALRNLGGAKNIGDRLPDQLLNLAAAADLISDATITRIHRLTLALGRLRGVDLRGLGSILSEQRRAAEAQARQVRQNQQNQAGGQSTDQQTEREQIQWTWNLRRNVQMIGGAWLSNVHPAIKLTVSILGAIGSLLGKILKTAWNIAKAVAKWAFRTAINALKKILSLVQKIANGIVKLSKDFGKNLVRNVQSIAKGMASVGKSIGQFAWKNSAVSRMTESIGKLRKVLSSFTRVAFYRVVRSAIKYITESFKEGAERAYFYAKEYGKATKYIAESLDKLSSKEFQMQNQLGAAWSTLLATIQPVLIQIINMVTRAAEVLTQFFAILGGKTTYLKAKDYTHDWADETEKGAKAAKEWKNQLMDFDTLNRLNEPTDNSSGKTDKYKDYENMFEEMPIESWIKDLKKLDAIEIGVKLSDGLNDFLNKLDDWFIEVRPKWKGFATDLADLLNSLIDGVDWELLGKTVGDGLNAIFDAINTFLKNVRWYDLGRGVGRAIKSLFDTVEWDLIGETFANKWNALLRFIEGLVTTPGIWQSIGRSIGQFVKAWIDNIDILSLANSVVHIINGVSTMIGAFLDQNPFQNLAPKLNDAIFLVITAVRWDELGTNIGRLFQTCLNTLFDIVSNFPFAQLGHNIAIFLDNMGSQIDFSQLGHLLMSIGLGLWKTLYGAVQYLEATGGIANMAKRLSNFIVGALTELAEWLESLDPRVIAGAIQQFIDNIDGTGIKDAFVRCVRAAWTLAVSVKEELFPDGLLNTVSKYISDWFAEVDWVKVGNTIGTKVRQAWTTAMAIFDQIWPPDSRANFLSQAIRTVVDIGWEIAKMFGQAIQDKFKETAFGKFLIAFNSVFNTTDQTISRWSQIYNIAKAAGLLIANKIGGGIEDGAPSIDAAMDNTVTKPTESKMTWLAALLKGSGKSAAYSLAQSIFGERDTVNDAMNNSFVKTSGSAVEAFLKNIGLVKPQYSQSAEEWKQIASGVEQSTTKSYDSIGTNVPKSMNSMKTELSIITVAVKKAFETMQEGSVKAAESMRDKLKSAFDAAKTAVKSVGESIGDAMTAMMKTASAKFAEGAAEFVDKIKSFLQMLQSAFGVGDGASVFVNLGKSMVAGLQTGFTSLWGNFSSAVSQLVSTLVSGISETVQKGFSGLSTAIGSAVTTASGKLNELASAARTSISTLLENSKTSLNSIVSSIQSAVNSIISKANSILSNLRGRSYATGGFPEDGVFFANHSELVGQFSNGKTAVANNEQIISGIRAGVYDAVKAAMGGSSNDDNGQPINVYIGDELVYSGYSKWNKRQQLLSGGRA